MEKFDNWPPFQDFSIQKFSFPVERYEEWKAGNIVASGYVHFDVYFKYSKGGLFSRNVSIDVRIENNPIISKLMSSFKFDRATTSGDRILFYIAAKKTNVANTSISMLSSLLGYTRRIKNYESNEPILASVFTINHNIAKISFSLGNPDRLIELY